MRRTILATLAAACFVLCVACAKYAPYRQAVPFMAVGPAQGFPPPSYSYFGLIVTYCELGKVSYLVRVVNWPAFALAAVAFAIWPLLAKKRMLSGSITAILYLLAVGPILQIVLGGENYPASARLILFTNLIFILGLSSCLVLISYGHWRISAILASIYILVWFYL